ncbi:ABC transporter substrate-binding protein [Actinocorallia longicatena]|uniref:ABC transporter substrate-binding protein n=1 Tax=Actinocorallia longicatena TaxID=111803 RepID=A0ABP6Q7E8_9ACTN
MKKIVPIAVAAALALAGCSSKGESKDGTGSDGVKTGPGVSADKITVGALTDLTGPFASLGKSVTQAEQLYFDQVNEAGGVCGRKIEVIVRDHGYDPQRAVAAYTELAPKVVGFPQFIGSPMVTAVKDRITADKVFTIPLAWSTALLGNKYVQVTGTTYDVQAINAFAFLSGQKLIKKGDKVGVVYAEGDYGQNALSGAKYAAQQLGVTLVEQKVKATDTDMTAQVSALKSAGVTAITASITPKAVASLAGVARAQGIKAPIIGNQAAYAPQLLETPAAPALLQGFYIVGSAVPLSSDLPAVKKLTTDYQAKFPGQLLDGGILAGFVSASIFGDALKKACEAKDLTHDGIITAHRAQNGYDIGFGLKADFTSVDVPPTLADYVMQPDKASAGGLKVVAPQTASELVKGYKVPAGTLG